MGYRYTDYAIVGGALSKNAAGYWTEYGSWNTIAIPVPTSAWFALALDFQAESIALTRKQSSFAWTISCGVDLANSSGGTLATIGLGYVNDNTGWAGNAGFTFTKPFSFLAAVAKSRIWMSCVSNAGIASPSSCTISAGKVRIYYTSDEQESADVEAESDGGDDVPLLHIVGAGAAGRRISKLRYRFTQALADAGAWSGTPIGTKVYRLPVPPGD
jgi:hypothetical protein